MLHRVPGSMAELTADWLSSLLTEAGPEEVEIGPISVEPLGSGVGLLGDLARIRIGDPRPSTVPPTIIVKLPTSDPAGHDVGRMLRAWPREIAFYNEIAPRSPGARVPRCYGTQADEALDRWVLVLEDCPADLLDPRTGASPSQALAATVALADFHASWWESAEMPSWMPRVVGEGFGGLQAAWNANHPAFLERYGAVLPSTATDWLRRFAAQLPSWADRVAAEPTTIAHADYRLDNLIFSGNQVTMIDWQTALVGPGAMDLSCFVATSLSVDARRATEEGLISAYVERLGDHSVEVDAEWLDRSYDENLLWWMGQFANNLAHLEPEDPSTAEGVQTMVERTFTAAVDRDVGRLL